MPRQEGTLTAHAPPGQQAVHLGEQALRLAHVLEDRTCHDDVQRSAGSAASAAGSVPSIADTLVVRLRSSASATSTSTAPADAARGSSARRPPEARSRSRRRRLPAKVGTWRRICRAESQTPNLSTTVSPGCPDEGLRALPCGHGLRLTATAVECRISVKVKVMKPRIVSRSPVAPRWLTGRAGPAAEKPLWT